MARSALLTLVLVVLVAVHYAAGGAVPRTVSTERGRIINGVDAAPGEFPFQLSVQLDFLGTYIHACGASILNEFWAISAAHCFEMGGFYAILAGTTSLVQGGSMINISETIIHPQYDSSNSWINDIALIKVATPFVLDGTTMGTIQLPAQGQETPDGSSVTVIGWGSTSFGGSSPAELQKVDIVVWNQELCSSLFWDGFEYPVYPTMICAAGVEQQAGSCNGDSGGPLFHEGVLVGIVSWSYNCGEPPYPDVFTRVSSYVDWINQYITA
ncbi:mite allergen Der f 3-like [Schistocerca cancellata]|uniref:mite allergen Der f 3-like n=1 Tax=Schistocerca cancellata TaxID=274614 RepID=UPI002118EF54|nr:mite allergen Der f 3-like [Schistocerca cancellata]